MTTVNIPGSLRQALKTNTFCRNGKYPDAYSMTYWQEETNRILRLRPKSWSFGSELSSIPSVGGAGERERWRFALHSSTFARYLAAKFVMAQTATTTNPLGFFNVFNPGTPATEAVGVVRYGNSTATISDTPANFGVLDCISSDTTNYTTLTEITPNADLEIRIGDYDNARIVSVTIFELSLDPSTANGYLDSGVTVASNIYDAQRQGILGVVRDAWKYNGGPVFTWSSDTEASAPTNATATAKNILDTSVTSVSASSPGPTVDLTYRSTVRRASSGVPCIMKIYAKSTTGSGTVYLKDSGGSTIVSKAITSGTMQWWTASAFYLPASLAKYDILFDDSSGTTTVRAVSIYQYEA